jgi:hypothetical protein
MLRKRGIAVKEQKAGRGIKVRDYRRALSRMSYPRLLAKRFAMAKTNSAGSTGFDMCI